MTVQSAAISATLTVGKSDVITASDDQDTVEHDVVVVHSSILHHASVEASA